MLECGFFPSRGGDRVYSAEQFGKIMDFLITDGVYEVYPETGVLYDESGRENKAYAPFKVQYISSKDAYYSPNNPSVIVGPGRAWFDHTWTHVSTPEVVSMPSDPSSGDRWDALVLTMDKSEAMRRNYFEWVQGDRNVDAPPISKLKGHYMHGDQVHQVPIAFVKRRANSNGAPLQIRSAVGYALCPFVRSINGSRNNVWSVQHIIDAASAKIDERIATMDRAVDEWMAEKDEENKQYLQGLKNEVSAQIMIEVNDQFDQLNRSLSTRIQNEVSDRLKNIDNELADKVNSAVTEKMNSLDIEALVNSVVSSEFSDRFTKLEGSITSTAKKTLLDAHPIGSYYWSNTNTDPSDLFGGTWVKVEGRFIYAKKSSETVGSTGGQESVTLTQAHMPSHTHTLKNGSHSHTISSLSHTHIHDHQHKMEHGHSLNMGNSSGHTGGNMLAVGDCNYVNKYEQGLGGGSFFGNNWGYIVASVANYKGNSGWINSSGTSSTITGSALTGTYTSSTVQITCESTGSGIGFNTMPPYYATNCWRRTA